MQDQLNVKCFKEEKDTSFHPSQALSNTHHIIVGDGPGTSYPTILPSDGTAALPSLSFALDSSTGLYRTVTGTLAFSVVGVQTLELNLDGTLETSTGDILVARTSTDTLTNKTLILPIIASIVNGGTLTLPTSTDTLVGRATTDTLTNKTLTNPTITNAGTLTLPVGPDTLVARTSTDTLTNKTLTAPVIATIVNTGTLTLPTSTDTLVGRATTDTLTNKTLTLPVIASIVNSGTLTLPTSTDTLIGRATTDTLTNKTLTAPVIATIVNVGTLTLPTSTDTLVGRATTDTLTNKTLTAPVISTIVNTGTLTLPTSTDTLVGRATTDTLTNKTLTLPTIASINNGGTLTLPSGTDTLVSKNSVDTLTNKSLSASTCAIVDSTDATKKLAFSTSGASASTTLTIADSQTSSQTLNIPNITAADTIVTTGSGQIISGNKLFTSIGALVSSSSSTYTTGTASQSGTTITGSGTTFTTAMVGGLVIFANNVVAFISAFGSTTSLTAVQSQTVTAQNYTLYYGGLQSGGSGNLGVSNLNISALTASQAVVSDANKNLASLGYSTTATASNLVQRDTNANTFSNNTVKAYTTTATAAGTTTLTAASTYHQYFTGTTTQTVVLPVVSTLALGFEFNIVNNSTGAVTVQSSGGNTIQTMLANTSANFTCILTTGTTAASWSVFSSLISIGGSNTQVQYNNNGVLGGTSMLTVASDSIIVAGDDSGAAPTAPSAGCKVYSKFKAGRRMLTQISTNNTEYSFQPAFFDNKIALWSAQGNSSSAVALINFGNSTTGTVTARNVASDNLFDSMRRIGFVTGALAGNSAGTRHNLAQYFISTNTTYGGFFYVARFGISSASAVSAQRSFVGLWATTSVMTNGNPSGNTSIIGFGNDTSDTSWSFIHSNATGPATKDALTGTFSPTATNTTMFEARIYSPAGTAIVYYSLEALGGGSFYEGSTSTNIPATGTLLSPQIWTNNGNTSFSAAIDVVTQYIETDM